MILIKSSWKYSPNDNKLRTLKDSILVRYPRKTNYTFYKIHREIQCAIFILFLQIQTVPPSSFYHKMSWNNGEYRLLNWCGECRYPLPRYPRQKIQNGKIRLQMKNDIQKSSWKYSLNGNKLRILKDSILVKIPAKKKIIITIIVLIKHATFFLKMHLPDVPPRRPRW